MANVYNTIYRGDFCNKSGDDIIVDIKRRMSDTLPIPIPQSFVFAGENNAPVTIDYSDKGDLKGEPINGCSCSINLKALGSFELASLYAADEREWQIIISGAWKYSGWLIPDSCKEPYASKPYDISIKGTDALGTLKDVPFLTDGGTRYTGFFKDIDVLRFALQKTGLDLGFTIGINTFEDSMDVSACPLSQAYINVAAFYDGENNAFSCYEVIRSIAERWGAQLHQFNGVWQLVNTLEKSNGLVSCWNFDPNGGIVAPSILGNEVTAGGLSDDLQPVGDNSFAKALASSIAYYRYGYPSNKLKNGDMDTWTSNPVGLPNEWTVQGGATAHTETRLDTDGNPTTDHYITIDSSGAGGFLYNTNFVSIKAGETVTISFDMVSPAAFAPILESRALGVRITDGGASYYNAVDGWTTTGSFYVIRFNASEFIGQINVNFKVAPRAFDYYLYFGVQSVQSSTSDYPTSINNVNISASVTADQTKPPVGSYNKQKSLTAQTYTKDPILILHGDDANDRRTSQISIGSASPVFPSSLWKRKGITESVSLLHTIANSELIMHSRPYRIFEAEFKGMGYIDINTILTIQLLDGIYIFLSGSFDLKTDIRTLRFAQVLTEQIPYTEEVSEDYGTKKDKDGISVGTPTGVNAPSSGASYIDLSGYAKTSDIPVKASAIETANGTNDNKFITPFKLLGWWTNIKTIAQTISGIWDFTARPTYNGDGLAKLNEIPSLTGYAPLANPLFTGNPTAPTPAPGDNDTSIATTSFVTTAISNFRGSDSILSKSASYTISMSDFGSNGHVTIYVDTTSGNIAITLPAASSMNGYTSNIIKTSSDVNSVVVTGTINGVVNDLLSSQYDAGSYKSNGTSIFKF